MHICTYVAEHLVGYLLPAAIAVKFQAVELMLANNTVALEVARVGVMIVATVLRYWHETVLYAGTTAPGYFDSPSYTPYTVPAYRTTPNVEQVRPERVLVLLYVPCMHCRACHLPVLLC